MPKDIALHKEIMQEHEHIHELSEEKVVCAECVMHLLTKAIGLLNIDLSQAIDRNGEAVTQNTITGSMGGSRHQSRGCWNSREDAGPWARAMPQSCYFWPARTIPAVPQHPIHQINVRLD